MPYYRRAKKSVFPFLSCHICFPSRPRSISRFTSVEEKPVTSLRGDSVQTERGRQRNSGRGSLSPSPCALAHGAWCNTGKTLQTLPGPALPKGLLPPGSRTLSAFPGVSDLEYGREHLPRSKPVAGTHLWCGLVGDLHVSCSSCHSSARSFIG